MTPPSWRAVLFDLDGTLADTVELILMSFRHTFQTHRGVVPPDSAFLEGIGKPLPVQLSTLAHSEEERGAMLATYVAYQRSIHDTMVRPFPGVMPVLDGFRGMGCPLGIVTSKGRSIAERTLAVCGLTEAFDCVVCGDEVARGKPDPEPVVLAMGQLGVGGGSDEVLFVGDSPHDITAGRSAGVKTAAVGWGPIERPVLEAAGPDYFVDRVEDLLGLRR